MPLTQKIVDKMLVTTPDTFVIRPSFIQGMLDVKEGKEFNDTNNGVIDGMLYTHGRQLAVIIKVDQIIINNLDDIAKAYKMALEDKDIV